jgi:1-acyl-sn-glycerol-3-phosphate acyltransferase
MYRRVIGPEVPRIPYASAQMAGPSEPRPLSPDREGFADRTLEVLGKHPEEERAALREEVVRALREAGDWELRAFLERVAATGDQWGYHPPDPLARRISRAIHRVLLEPGSHLAGIEALEVARERPVLFLGNHISFGDANVLEHFISEAGYEDVAVRLMAAVGPKVYTSTLRRLASLCFGTIKLPQSASRASGEAVMPLREVARLSREALAEARERMLAGHHLIVFVEGTRSRSGAMQPALAAVARYLEFPGALVIPFGLAGSERLSPIDEPGLMPARVEGRLGSPVEARRILDACGRHRARAMNVVGTLVARLIPPAHRGVYAEDAAEHSGARAIADFLSRSPR